MRLDLQIVLDFDEDDDLWYALVVYEGSVIARPSVGHLHREAAGAAAKLAIYEALAEGVA